MNNKGTAELMVPHQFEEFIVWFSLFACFFVVFKVAFILFSWVLGSSCFSLDFYSIVIVFLKLTLI